MKIATLLNLLTLVCTIIASLPGLYNIFSEKPLVFYESKFSQIIPPAEFRRSDITKILQDNNIEDSAITVNTINIGDTSATSLSIIIKVPGKILTVGPSVCCDETLGATITHSKIEDGTYSIKFSNFYPEFELKIYCGYTQTSLDQPEIFVFYNDKNAIKLKSLDDLPHSIYTYYLELPFQVLMVGLLISIAIGLTILSIRNKQFRMLLFEVLLGSTLSAVPLLVSQIEKITEKK